MPQFFCAICREGFEQLSRFERHIASSHPRGALTAADVEHALAGIDFPAFKRDLVRHAEQQDPRNDAAIRAIRGLPDRVYRDAAEVARAYGQTVSGRPAEFIATEPPPSVRGGLAAASGAVSAAAVARMLGGIDFPASREGLLEHARARRGAVADPEGVLSVLERLPDRRYESMADVEVEVGRIL